MLAFSSRSAPAFPWKGRGGEHPPANTAQHLEEFVRQDIDRYKHFRQILSNFWPAPFKLDGKTYKTVEHAYQSAKYAGTSFADEFTLDSGSEISTSAAMAKAAGGKSGKFKGKHIRPPGLTVVPGFEFKSTRGVMERAQMARFQQHPDDAAMLIATGRCALVHIMRGTRVRFAGLENVRDILRDRAA